MAGSFGSEFVAQFRKARAEQRAAEATRAPRKTNVIGVMVSLLVNAVTAIGVFQFHWTVGTGLTLYWAENVMTAIVVAIVFAIWRVSHASDPLQPRTKTGEVVMIGTAFNLAHLIFLPRFSSSSCRKSRRRSSSSASRSC